MLRYFRTKTSLRRMRANSTIHFRLTVGHGAKRMLCPPKGRHVSLRTANSAVPVSGGLSGDTYQNIMRFAGASILVFVLFCSTFLFIIWFPFNIGACVFLGYPVTLGIETSGLLLYRRTFVRLFPPQLQRGTPYFITLNLDPHRESKSDGNGGHGKNQDPTANS